MGPGANAEPDFLLNGAQKAGTRDPDVAPLPAFNAERVGARQPTDAETLALLRERFVESNRRLVELTGIDYNTEG